MDDELGSDMGKNLGRGLGADLERPASRTAGGDVTGEIAPAQAPLGFWLLGAFQMTVAGRPWQLGAEQEQRLLVALLDARGARVSHGRLREAIWDDEPEGAQDALYHLARALRRRLEAAGWVGVLPGVNGTYALAIPADCVDVHQFHALVDQARDAARQDDARAMDLLAQALRLHRGEPLAGMGGRWVDNYRHALIEERRAVELALHEVAISRGEFRERLPGLQAMFRERPQDEWVAWLLMHALYRAGRQPEALAVRQQVAEQLDTVAVASLKALGDLYERILRHDEDLLRPEALSFPVGTVGVRARALGRPGSHAPHREQDQPGHEQDEAEEAAPQDESDDAGQPTGQSARDSRPYTSIVINGSVHARGGSVIGTQNNYGGSR